jgi:hypothetical protein
MASRRQFLQTLATSVFAVAAVGMPAAQRQRDSLGTLFSGNEGGHTEAPPWALLYPLRAGSKVGKGWSIASLGGVERGAAVLTLKNADGRTARVHLCASKGAPIGVAHSKSIDLLLMDGGSGTSQTDEDLGRVLKGIARRITVNERQIGQDAGAFFARLESHHERVATYGAGTLV